VAGIGWLQALAVEEEAEPQIGREQRPDFSARARRSRGHCDARRWDAGRELRRHCAGVLADYKIPETFRRLEGTLPRNANGKVLTRSLRPRGVRRAVAPPSSGVRPLAPSHPAPSALRRFGGRFGSQRRQRVHHALRREDHDHLGPDPHGRVQAELPAVQLDQPLDDRQPQARSFFRVFLRQRPPAEGRQHDRDLFGRNAGAGVGDGEILSTLPGPADLDGDRAALSSVGGLIAERSEVAVIAYVEM
jgi:hypothetical protein